jgi:hypothetical protein
MEPHLEPNVVSFCGANFSVHCTSVLPNATWIAESDFHGAWSWCATSTTATFGGPNRAVLTTSFLAVSLEREREGLAASFGADAAFAMRR